jgi:SAM-dependent methyltransferase
MAPGSVSERITHPLASARAVARRVRRLVQTRHETPCLVCGSRRTHVTTVPRKRRSYDIRVCEACGYLSNFTNTVDYSAFQSVESFRLSPRVGTELHRGREFHMGAMGVDILCRSGLKAMVFGAGRSLDYRHLGALPQIDRVVMSDVVELTTEADFVNISQGTSERFDLIIACEVVEHFTDPVAEFQRLLELLTPGGLLVCSTNIYDGGNFAKHTYLYLRGHVSYYSNKAIELLARKNKANVRFVVPAIAQGSVGPRKRYLLFTRAPEILSNIDRYVACHEFAPSEDVQEFTRLHPDVASR